MLRAAVISALSVLPGTGAATTLDLPSGAQLTAEATEAQARALLPLGPWADGAVQTVPAEGQVSLRAWRLPGGARTTLQVLEPLRAQLLENGYEVQFACADHVCGGFDFRYAMELLPEPDMHVDLGDFQYLLARRAGAAGPEHLALTVSRAPEAGFVHLTHVSAAAAPAPSVVASSKSFAAVPVAGLPSAAGGGRIALDDLEFGTGDADLGPGPYPSLAALAEALAAAPAARLVLVGHTDAVGGLDGNVALSRRRADAVRARLISAHGVAPGRVTAEGIGWLAPRADNADPAGREANRRVEALLLGG
ncbi:OmpA family protein [Rhodobacteraceae bacterium CCMM004]|nr:OmpA family protein [Rhodobacteraceae bacterium CCMM004]